MAEWEEFTAPCPACEGAGCESCADLGRLAVPSRVEKYANELRGEMIKLRTTRRKMLKMYRRWTVSTFAEKIELMSRMPSGAYDDIPNDPDGHRQMDVLMSRDILDCESSMAALREAIAKGEEIANDARELWRNAKRVVKARTAKPEPPPLPPREEKHEPCYEPGCGKDPKVWDAEGHGWCRPHAYEQGLLGGGENGDSKKKERWPDELRGG